MPQPNPDWKFWRKIGTGFTDAKFGIFIGGGMLIGALFSIASHWH